MNDFVKEVEQKNKKKKKQETRVRRQKLTHESFLATKYYYKYWRQIGMVRRQMCE